MDWPIVALLCSNAIVLWDSWWIRRSLSDHTWRLHRIEVRQWWVLGDVEGIRLEANERSGG